MIPASNAQQPLGASIGNLILAGGLLNNEGDIASVIFLFSQLVEVRGVVRPVSDADLHFDWYSDPPAMLAWLEPINHRIRDRDVTDFVSDVAAIKRLREHMVRKQRIIAEQHPRLVTEGRDVRCEYGRCRCRVP